ncbi:hypothetical protein D3C77_790000 [compost metagenome]
MNDPFGNALAVEVSELLDEVNVLQEHGATRPRREAVLVVGDGLAEVGRERAVGHETVLS